MSILLSGCIQHEQVNQLTPLTGWIHKAERLLKSPSNLKCHCSLGLDGTPQFLHLSFFNLPKHKLNSRSMQGMSAGGRLPTQILSELIPSCCRNHGFRAETCWLRWFTECINISKCVPRLDGQGQFSYTCCSSLPLPRSPAFRKRNSNRGLKELTSLCNPGLALPVCSLSSVFPRVNTTELHGQQQMKPPEKLE